ncbi:MAG: glycerophosphodiester phosphodiesterase family protein [Vampirovibrionales bacterium]|nr:glycerophosphodiester phosphodiesterase family protein [Vampirovibrionales bacterium]
MGDNHDQFSNLAPEDTAEALLMAGKMGVAVEFDVLALSGDERRGDRNRNDTDLLIVHHDTKTGRIFELPGRQRPVRHLTRQEWEKVRPSVRGNKQVLEQLYGAPVRLKSTYVSARPPKAKPLIRELLRQSDAHLYLELKMEDDTRWQAANNARATHSRKYNYPEIKIAKLFEELEAENLNPHGRITVISFSPASLRLLHRLDPRIETGLSCVLSLKTADNLSKSKRFIERAQKGTGISAILPPADAIRQPFMSAANSQGLRVLPWVEIQQREEEASDFSRLIGTGVQGILTNAPDLLMAHVGQNPFTLGA